MNTQILITGANGYVGRATYPAALAARYAVIGTYHRQPPVLPDCRWEMLDLSDPAGVLDLIVRVRPHAIIHAGAAWSNPEEAESTITRGTRAVAEGAARMGARLIHLSTDVLFDGEHGPYREADAPNPLTYYGSAKAAAEEIVANVLTDYVIVRTSLVTCFDPPDPRTQPVLRALRVAQGLEAPDTRKGAGMPVTLFTDEYRCPVLTADLAAALVELVDHPYRGVLHVAGPERLSRYELGQRIAAHHRLSMDGVCAGTIASSGLVRPRDCALDTTLARAILRTPLRPIPGRGPIVFEV